MTLDTTNAPEPASPRSPESLPVVDCDVHAVVPSVEALLPYVDEYRADVLTAARFPHYIPNFHPPRAPITERPDATRPENGVVGGDAATLCGDVFVPNGPDIAILFALYGI